MNLSIYELPKTLEEQCYPICSELALNMSKLDLLVFSGTICILSIVGVVAWLYRETKFDKKAGYVTFVMLCASLVVSLLMIGSIAWGVWFG